MTKRTVRIIFCSVLWVVLVILGANLYLRVDKMNVGFAEANDAVQNEYAVYVTDNTADAGLVYRLTKDGEVTNLFSTKDFEALYGYRAEYVDTVDENPYAVFSKEVDDGREVTYYVVASFNEGMQITYLSPAFRLPLELNLTGFSAYEDKVYLTALSDDGMQVYVYQIATSGMARIDNTKMTAEDLEKWHQAEIEVSEVMMDNSPSLRFYSDAVYRDDELVTQSDNVRTDSLRNDTFLKKLFNNRKESVGIMLKASTLSLPVVLMVAMMGVLVIILLGIVMRDTLRSTYAFLWYEVFLVVVVCFFFAFFTYGNRKSCDESYEAFCASSLKAPFYTIRSGLSLDDTGFYDTDEYYTLLDYYRDLVADSEDLSLSNVVLFNTASGQVILSTSGTNRGQITDMYGSGATELLSGLSSKNLSVMVVKRVNGRRTRLLCTSLEENGYGSYAVIAASKESEIYQGLFLENKSILWFFGMFLMIGTLVGILYFWLEGRDLARLGKALSRLADGEEKIDKPVVSGKDMNHMWNSIYEIQKNFLETNRIKFLTYAAYYRFAPKSVERILKKPSITEVQGGDSISLKGTMAVVSTSHLAMTEEGNIDQMNKLLVVTEECRETYDGIFVSQDSDLSLMKLLFLEKNKDTVSFGTEFLQKLREEKDKIRFDTTLILHYAPYIYGVAGTKEQSSVYLFSKELDILQQYAGWFRNLHLGLVVTKELLDHEKPEADVRYIGFILPDEANPSRRLMLYEVLDAESVRNHQMRKYQAQKFTEALEMFYQQDFYLARNVFTEIVRDSQGEDDLAKWYLFECERYLNEVAPEDFVGALHGD
ncbi:MAG: hypothetical protein K6G07_02405 [Lachnospiraceae bacterium]|nr:hypothetical protein [Lachnospiraceae bacterium]